MVLISYDVGNVSTIDGARRLRRIAKACKNYGQRVQYSVFECEIPPDVWVKLKNNLLNEMNPKEDSLRFYYLGSNWKRRVEHIGAKPVVDLNDTLIF